MASPELSFVRLSGLASARFGTGGRQFQTDCTYQVHYHSVTLRCGAEGKTELRGKLDLVCTPRRAKGWGKRFLGTPSWAARRGAAGLDLRGALHGMCSASNANHYLPDVVVSVNLLTNLSDYIYIIYNNCKKHTKNKPPVSRNFSPKSKSG